MVSMLDPVKIKGKRVLIRVDYNLPIENRQISDATRVNLTIPNIKQLLDNQNQVILISHLGRPKGYDAKFSLAPIRTLLEQQLDQKVAFFKQPISRLISNKTALPDKNQAPVILLENLRFDSQEENNDPDFAKGLAQWADLYINDAFSVCHRRHASIEAITKFLPAYAGFLFNQELKHLRQIIEHPERPLVTIVGGAKISTKVGAVKKLAEVSDVVLVGGGVANHFIKADGYDTGQSPLESEQPNSIAVADEIIQQTRLHRILLDGYIPLPKIIYPVDVISARSLRKNAVTKTVNLTEPNHIQEKKSLKFLDIGPKTARLFTQIIQQAGTVFWNGPMGVFEVDAFAQGTRKIAQAIAKSPATSIVGGGDSISAINHLGLVNRYDYVSASGGAALEFLSGSRLPGIVALERVNN